MIFLRKKVKKGYSFIRTVLSTDQIAETKKKASKAHQLRTWRTSSEVHHSGLLMLR